MARKDQGKPVEIQKKPEGFFSFLKWLDPFTYVDLYVMPRVNPNKNQNIELAVYLVSAFVFAYILYNFVLAGLLGTSAPLVIVYSGSMEPTLYRGDIVILQNAGSVPVKEISVDFPVSGKALREFAQVKFEQAPFLRASAVEINGKTHPLDSGAQIVVYTSNTVGEDIIHRAVLKIRAPDGVFIITQGDNVKTNQGPDQDCRLDLLETRYCISPRLIKEGELKGKYVFHIPLVGYVKLIIFDELPKLFGLIRR